MRKIELDKEQIQFWKRNSYIILKGFFAKQADDISGWIEEISGWPENMSRHLNFYEMHNPSELSRIENFVPFHSSLGTILNSDEILGLVGQLMGEEAILYKDRINFKPPGGGAHAAHQDGVAYESGDLAQFEENSVPYISILIGVDPATKENGCFEVVSNWSYDDLSILPMEKPDAEHPNFSKIAQSVEDELDWIQIETEPGDVILFTERLPHRSKSNQSKGGRRILYGVYNPATLGDKREAYYTAKRKNLNDPRYMVGNPHAPSV